MVAFNINQFRTQIDQKDLLRNNKFVFRVNIPTGLTGIEEFKNQQYRDVARNLLYYCEAAAQPSMSITGYNERKWGYGPKERRPTVTEYTDQRITFFEDGASDNFQFFYDWLRLINYGNQYHYEGDVGGIGEQVNSQAAGPSDPYELSYRRDYMVDADLFIFDQKGNPVRQIHYNEMYPLAIEEAPLSWADNNSLLRLGVNFTFKEWYAVKTISDFIPTRQNVRRTVPAWLRDIQNRFLDPLPEPLG